MSNDAGWAAWPDASGGSASAAWTIGVEEEVMLLEPDGWMLAPRIEDVLLALPPGLSSSVAAETHASTLELNTAPHATVAGAIHELGGLRGRLTAVLGRLGLRAATAGTHPAADWRDVHVSPGARYQAIHDSMRELARREPTFATHVHVAVPEPEQAILAMRRLRSHLPLLLALSANSPFLHGRDSGLASARIPVFDAFPRAGIPRAFTDYGEYVATVDELLAFDAFPDHTFLWWDVRLQPRYGTIEVRIMDAQTRLGDVGALAALVQCLVRMTATYPETDDAPAGSPELLEENRFLATRDGMDALLLDPVARARRPASELVEEVVEACRPHALALGCEQELEWALELAATPGAARQRALHEAGGDARDLRAVAEALSHEFLQSPAALMA